MGTEKANVVLQAVEKAIQNDPANFDKFVNILRTEPAHKRLAEELGKELPSRVKRRLTVCMFVHVHAIHISDETLAWEFQPRMFRDF